MTVTISSTDTVSSPEMATSHKIGKKTASSAAEMRPSMKARDRFVQEGRREWISIFNMNMSMSSRPSKRMAGTCTSDFNNKFIQYFIALPLNTACFPIYSHSIYSDQAFTAATSGAFFGNPLLTKSFFIL